MDERRVSGPFVITGLSGSGKTILSRSLEDIGYLCVDNIPLDLVAQLFDHAADELDRLVIVLDVRTKGLTARFPEFHRQLIQKVPSLRLLFVEASPEMLLRRYSVARRPHPLRDRGLEQAVSDEREALAQIRSMADLVIDTTNFSPHDLKRQALSLAGFDRTQQLLSIELLSFSYLQGIPPTASLVFDVRFLPNPFFEEELRGLSGDDLPVKAWLDASAEVQDALKRIGDLVGYLLPRYGRELKTHLMIAIGCTGGRHRSVYVADRLIDILRALGYEAKVHHRDKDRWRYA